MQGKKIVSVISTFDEQEWRACHKFLKFCTKEGAKTLKIFNHLFKNRKDLHSKKCEWAYIHKRICADISWKSFLNRLSELASDIDSFLVFREIRQEHHKYDFKKTLSEIYKRRGLYPMFVKTVKDLEKEIQDDGVIDLFKSYRLLELNHMLYFSDLYGKKKKDSVVLDKAMIYNEMFKRDIETYYKTEKFHAQRLRPTKVDSVHIDQNQLNEVLIHYEQLTKFRSEESYVFLEHYLMAYHQSISGELSQTLLVSLMNHAIYKTKQGFQDRITQIAMLNIFGLENGMLLEYNKLSETRFLNIVDAVSKSKLEMGTDVIIDKWAPFVNTQDLESLHNMAYAMWYFAKGEYGKTLEHLNYFNVNLISLNYSLRSRWMQLCSLCSSYPEYEFKEEALNSAIAYFRRQKENIDEATYKGSMNLIKIVRWFWHREPIEMIENALQEFDYLIFKYWINKQIRIHKESIKSS